MLSLSFAGIANKPGADELFRCMIAPRRARWQTAWLVDVLKVAAVDPPQLVKLVREDALSIYDLAAVVTEARCDYGLRTDWLNKHAPPPAGLPRPRPKQLGGTAPSGIALNCVRRGTQGHSPHVGLISYIHGPSGGP